MDPLWEGKGAFASIRLPEPVMVGGKDPVELRLVLINSLARLMHIGDKYLDGRAAAAALGVQLDDEEHDAWRCSRAKC